MSGVFLIRMRVYPALRIASVLSISRARQFSSVVLYRGFPPWVKRPSYSIAILCSWFARFTLLPVVGEGWLPIGGLCFWFMVGAWGRRSWGCMQGFPDVTVVRFGLCLWSLFSL